MCGARGSAFKHPGASFRSRLMTVDIYFDVRSDIRPGSDPDKHSQQLRRFHKNLWSKALPNGTQFDLRDDIPNKYLSHSSPTGDFSLSSDSIVHSLFHVKRAAPIISQIGGERMDHILSLFNTLPGFILFPGNRIGGRMTLNGARGFNARIADRFDLTLECIRRHYATEQSPLSDVIARYGDFFALFESFDGYLDFFLLQDLWDFKQDRLNTFLPFDGSFPLQPLPKSVEEYEAFVERQSTFLNARAARMVASS